MALHFEFDPGVVMLQEESRQLSRAVKPDFAEAHMKADNGLRLLTVREPSIPNALHIAGVETDIAAVEVRKGLHANNLSYVQDGTAEIFEAYDSVRYLVRSGGLARIDQPLLPAIRSQLAIMQTYWFKGVQAQQIMGGRLSKHEKADEDIVREGWMLGRGILLEPGAWRNARQGIDHAAAVETAFTGVRAEVINGGIEHRLKAAKWAIVRGAPELPAAMLLGPHRMRTARSAGRLVFESMRRSTALQSV